MTRVAVSIVDVYPVRDGATGLELLVLRRGPRGRCAGAWEAVHGHIESGESPIEAARRELAEETGLTAVRWYNLSRVELFYQHRQNEVALVPIFVAFIQPDSRIATSAEHDDFEWLSFDRARTRLAWPRERRALDDIHQLLGTGGAGVLDDVLGID